MVIDFIWGAVGFWSDATDGCWQLEVLSAHDRWRHRRVGTGHICFRFQANVLLGSLGLGSHTWARGGEKREALA